MTVHNLDAFHKQENRFAKRVIFSSEWVRPGHVYVLGGKIPSRRYSVGYLHDKEGNSKRHPDWSMSCYDIIRLRWRRSEDASADISS